VLSTTPSLSKSQDHEVTDPVERSVNSTVKGAIPEVELTEKAAIGGAAGGDTVSPPNPVGTYVGSDDIRMVSSFAPSSRHWIVSVC
jgi:hypothetical protein